MRKVYAAAMHAEKRTSNGPTTMAIHAGWCFAADIQEARAGAIAAIQRNLPPTEGWINHGAEASEIPWSTLLAEKGQA